MFRKARALRVILAIAFVIVGPWSAPPARAAEEKEEPQSVYQVLPVRDGAITAGLGLVSLYPALNGYHFIYIQPNPNPDNLVPWDRKAIGNSNKFLDNWSDATVVVSVAAPVLLDYVDVGWSHVLYEDLFVYAETLMSSTALTAFLKYTSQRPIPLVYTGDPSLRNAPRGYEGFYSGHVATTMCALSATALTLDLRHDAGVWPWFIVGAVGGTVAWERVEAGEHFPTQVLAGAVMGPLVGVLVPWLHKRVTESKPAISLMPTGDGAEVTWTKHF